MGLIADISAFGKNAEAKADERTISAYQKEADRYLKLASKEKDPEVKAILQRQATEALEGASRAAGHSKW